MSSHTTAMLRTPSRFVSLLGILALCAAPCAIADTTSLTIAGTTKGTSNVPVTMPFPIVRLGDLGYETILNYHTIDGSAFAGIDYIAASGSIAIPVGASSAMIPVTLNPNTGVGATNQFQIILENAVGIGPTPTFAAQQTFTVGNYPNSVASTDVNGDGKFDLIVANNGSGTVSVLMNDTASGVTMPSFTAQQTFATGTQPVSVTVADVNGDGKPDLIVANYNDNSISVLLNTTTPGAMTPSFAAQHIFAVGTHPISVTAADVNGDGKPDLIVANEASNTISVLLNTTVPGAGFPSFTTQQTFATGNFPYSVTTADVNGDGKPDLIVTNFNDGTASVLLNTTAPGAATPGFAAQQAFAVGNSPYSIAAADVNGDGKPDLIVVNGGVNAVSVLLDTTAPGATMASFAAGQTFATGSWPNFVTAADVNGDGKPDLVVTNSNDGTASVLLNTTAPGAATPRFTAQQTFGAGSNPFTVTTVDVNGDGKPDLIVANQDGMNRVSVLLNTTSPSAATLGFTAQQAFAVGSIPFYAAAADINGDGKLDLIVTNGNDNTISVLLNTTAPGAITPSFASQQTFAAGSLPNVVAVADLNGDGKPDVIVANQGGNAVTVLLNTTETGATTLSFASPQTFATGSLPYFVTVADINGDGKPDLIVANGGGASVSVLLNTTTPGAIAPSFAIQQVFATSGDPYFVTAADMNGDGKPDLILTYNTGNTGAVLLNTTVPGASTPSFATPQAIAIGLSSGCITTADLNGDGRPDLAVTNYARDTVSVMLNTTTPGATTLSLGNPLAFATGSGPISVSTADVNNDGRPDLIVANYNDNTISVLRNNTAPGAIAPSFSVQQIFAAGPLPQSVTTADVNGDGNRDLIVVNSSGTVSVLLNTQYQTEVFGSPVTGTIVHDYIFADGFGP